MPSLGQKLVGGLTAPQPARISLNDGRFTLYTDNGAVHPTVAPALSIQVIFVGGNSHVSKRLYSEDEYDAENHNRPTCWSDNGTAPSDQVATPQSATCGMCPHNRWIGTGPTATPPVCSDRKKTAVMVSGAGSSVFLLDIPPASLKPFRKYMAYLGGEVHADPEEVITTLSMENRVLKFECAGHVPDSMKSRIKAIVDNPATDDVVNEHDKPHQLSFAPPAPAKPELFPKATAALHEVQFGTRPLPFADNPVDVIPEQFTVSPADVAEKERWAAVAADQAAREAKPMTSNEAQAFHEGGKAPRKPRSDKGVSRKETTTFTAQPAPEPQAGWLDQPKKVDERNPPPPNGGFIQPEPPKPAFGMAQPAPAPADMSDMLTKAFGLRIGT